MSIQRCRNTQDLVYPSRHWLFIALVVLLLAMLAPAMFDPDVVQAETYSAVPDCSPTLAFDTVVSCSIADLAEVGSYTFAANANDVIVIRVTRTGGTLQPRIVVQQAANQYLCGNFDLISTEVLCTIPANGTYTVLIDDTFRTRTGSYALYLQRFNNPVGAEAIVLGQPKSGEITAPAEAQFATFEVGAGDRVLLRISRSGGTIQPRMGVFDQAGRFICGNYGAETTESSCSFSDAGRYILVIDDVFRLNTGTYYVYLQRYNAPNLAMPVITGQTIAGMIQVPAEADAYTFTTSGAEQRFIRVTRTSDTLQPRITVFDVSGTYVCGNIGATMTEVLCELPQAATYLLLVDDTFRVSTGSYSLVFDCSSTGCSPQCPPQGCGTPPTFDKRLFVPIVNKGP